MNTTYYVAGIQYSAELYHHGIKGQKWGVRRYQNDDGTLTSAGRQRYGNNLSTNYEMGKQDLLRKLGTGDWAFGKKRGGERREQRLEKKLAKAEAKGKDTEKLSVKLQAQKERNVARDTYNSRTSTGVLIAQKLLLGRSGADSYRVARERGAGMAESVLPALLQHITGLPISTAISAKSVEGDIRRKRNPVHY